MDDLDWELMWRIALVVAIFALIVVVSLWASNFQCAQTAKAMEVESKYTVTTGCMIKPDGRWIPLENYRYFGEEK